VPLGRARRRRNMSSRGTGCTSEARKPGGTNLRRWRKVPARHGKANNERSACEKQWQRHAAAWSSDFFSRSAWPGASVCFRAARWQLPGLPFQQRGILGRRGCSLVSLRGFGTRLATANPEGCCARRGINGLLRSHGVGFPRGEPVFGNAL
jgi:hypothetical protein